MTEGPNEDRILPPPASVGSGQRQGDLAPRTGRGDESCLGGAVRRRQAPGQRRCGGELCSVGCCGRQRLHTFETNRAEPRSGQFLKDGKTFVTSNVGVDHCALYFWDVGARMKPLPKGVELPGKAGGTLGEPGLRRCRLCPPRPVDAGGLPGPERALPAPAAHARTIAGREAHRPAYRRPGCPPPGRPPPRPNATGTPLLACRRGDETGPAQARLPGASATTRRAAPGAGAPYTSPERLQRLRAIEALERIGSPAACKLLEEVAKGASTSAGKRGRQSLPPTPQGTPGQEVLSAVSGEDRGVSALGPKDASSRAAATRATTVNPVSSSGMRRQRPLPPADQRRREQQQRIQPGQPQAHVRQQFAWLHAATPFPSRR